MNKKTAALLESWNQAKDNLFSESPLILNETALEKMARIKKLENQFEDWAKYYFPKFYSSEPAIFHVKASQRILANPEWFEVRSWARELAKSTRTMMEVLFLVLTQKKKNILLVSSTLDNAKRLLNPYKKALELNGRIIADYGEQQSFGQWEEAEFVTQKKAAFRALGKGQSPRGTRNEANRPDVILIDDIDTDEECRNPERIKEAVKWIDEALIPTRSTSNPMLILACGNIISQFCCITEMAKKADHHEIINIRNKEGKSSWPNKNTEAQIDRALSLISFNSAQKEYYNNPISEGDVFKEITWGKLPSLASCDAVLVYADPSTSNKDKGKGSFKAVVVLARKGFQYFVYKTWLDAMSNDKFIDCLFEAQLFIKSQKVDVFKIYIENNSLQDPFYEQVLLPLIRKKAQETGVMIPVSPDTRRKADKFFRIEGTLEPINRLGNLIFNEKEKQNPHFQRLESQFLGVSEKAKLMDGPDAVEGGIWILQNRSFSLQNTYKFGKRISNRF